METIAELEEGLSVRGLLAEVSRARRVLANAIRDYESACGQVNPQEHVRALRTVMRELPEGIEVHGDLYPGATTTTPRRGIVVTVALSEPANLPEIDWAATLASIVRLATQDTSVIVIDTWEDTK